MSDFVLKENVWDQIEKGLDVLFRIVFWGLLAPVLIVAYLATGGWLDVTPGKEAT